jgi:signal transduction histidine kinase
MVDPYPAAEGVPHQRARGQGRPPANHAGRRARFAGDVSHELRSPLTTMLNAMAVLYRRRAEMPPGARQAVELLDTDLRRFLVCPR